MSGILVLKLESRDQSTRLGQWKLVEYNKTWNKATESDAY